MIRSGLGAPGGRALAGVIAIGAAVALTGCGTSRPANQTRSGAAGAHATGTSESATSTATRTVQITTTRTTTVPASTGAGPVDALELYWHDIGAGDYASAYRHLVPGSNPQTSAEFVSAEQQSRIESIRFRAGSASIDGATAEIPVDSLTTIDGDYGCRTWSGSYELSRQAGTWLIERATISPTTCPVATSSGSDAAATADSESAETATDGNGATGAADSNSGGANCSPIADSGNCYEPGEYCRDSDHGMAGTAGDGETITCEDNDGWRWEPD